MTADEAADPRALLVPVQRLGNPLERLAVERLGRGDGGHARDLVLDVGGQPRKGKQPADALARTGVPPRHLAVREPVAVDLGLDLDGQRKLARYTGGLGTRGWRWSGPLSTPL